MLGGCHCRTVTYEVDRFETSFGHCHCYTCRKTHAAAYVTTARVMRDNFRLLSGQDRLSAYESSPGKTRRFCSVCGCHIVADRAAQPYVILRTATLDDDPGIRPAVHIWRSHDAPWLIDEGELPSYPEAPPAR